MLDAEVEETIRIKYEQLAPYLNETSLRMWATVAALSLGHGGIISVARATGMSRTMIHAGISELKQFESGRVMAEEYRAVHRQGGGRKAITEDDPSVLEDLKILVDPGTRGDARIPLVLEQ